MRRTFVRGAVIAAAGVALSVFASSGAMAQEPERSPLAGPALRDHDEKPTPTLIAYDLDGSLRPLETTPEEAAVQLLSLDEKTKTKVQKVFDHRAAQIDALTINNLDLFNKLGTANAAGKTLDQIQLGVDLWRKTEPLRDAGSLRKQVKAALPSAQGAQFEAMLDAYWDAVGADGKRRGKANGGKTNAVGARLEARLKFFAQEVERSFLRQVKSGDLVYQYVFRGVTLSPDQSERLRGQWAEFWEKTKGDATKEEYIGLFMSISSQLDNEQRPIMIENLALLNNGGLFTKPMKASPAKSGADSK